MITNYSRSAFELAAQRVQQYTEGTSWGQAEWAGRQLAEWTNERNELIDAAHSEALDMNAELATCTDCEQGYSHSAPCPIDAAKLAAHPIVSMIKSTPTTYRHTLTAALELDCSHILSSALRANHGQALSIYFHSMV